MVDLTYNYTGGSISGNNNNKLNEYLITNNLNQAIYILTSEQIHILQRRCKWLDDIGKILYIYIIPLHISWLKLIK